MRKIILFSLSALLLAGCTKSPPSDTLFIHLGAEPPTLDPSRAESVVDMRILQNILEPLLEYDESLELHGAMANVWHVSEDGLTYTFDLETDRVWSDGKPVSAEDYRYSMLRTLDPKVPSKLAYLLYPIKNAKAFKIGAIKNSEAVGIKVTNPYQIVITLEQPSRDFIHAFANVITFPQRKDIVEKFGEKYGSDANIPSNGPYKLTEWKHDQQLTLVKNKSFGGNPKPRVEKIVARIVPELTTALSLFETGQLHILEQFPPDTLQRFHHDPRMRIYPDFSTYFIGFDTRKKPFSDKRVRLAFALSLNKEQIENILQGDQPAAYSFVPPGIPGFNPTIGLRFDKAKAEKLLKEAGYPEGKGFPQVTFGFNTDVRHQRIAEWLEQQWRMNLGVSVKLQSEEWKVYLKTLQLSPPNIYRFAWASIFPDPLSPLLLWVKGNPNNYTGWSSSKYDSLVDEIAKLSNSSQKLELVDQAQRLLVEDDVPFIPIYFYARNILVNPAVNGFRANGLGVLGYKYIYLEPIK
ncbi:MAG TPA: peptide ABC transporter substrate-binding protein [Bdellovibrionota bacterium]|nr:peptide ABC transporter substrate-binding protein [Bdellovibrionota bacterium]